MLNYHFPHETKKLTPFLLSSISAGHPEEVFEEYSWVDLDELLQTGNSTMIYARVCGFSMVEAEIYEGDLLVIELTDQAKNGDIVVVEINGRHTIKYWKDVKKMNGKRTLSLVPANATLKDLEINRNDDFRIVGIVRHKIQSY